MSSLDTFIRCPQMSPVFAGKLVEGHTCARANSSRSSHVLLTFSSEMVAFCTIATPPSPRLRPVGEVTQEDTLPAARSHIFYQYLLQTPGCL